MNRLVFVVVLAFAGFYLVTSIPTEVQPTDIYGPSSAPEAIKIALNSIKQQQEEYEERINLGEYGQNGAFNGLLV